ncbi:hypothetical protein [Polaribacter sp. SA4-12]|uniref:hypothetical protein n=1 Tax=Polaribacter sp. SA4-12 TaxID=1312072 RepID=UPI000B3C7DC7|nr:hypothetical protein [Polaribacter sp. SA4-12]ARV16373.1 hypothetical protein BTO07_15055 [Polaribacter sp. SA4-12]
MKTKYNTKEAIKPILIIIVTMIIFFNISKNNDSSKFYENLVLKNYNMKFKGTVIEINRDNRSDYYNTIKIQNYLNKEELFFFNYESPNFLNNFKIGDTIVKLKEQFLIKLTRNNKDLFIKLKVDGYKYYNFQKNNPDSIMSIY